MTTTYQSFLTQILEAIDYEGEKEKFVTDFIKDCELETLLELIETLPVDQQITVKEKLAAITQPEEVSQLLKTHFTEQQLQETFDKNANNEIKGLMEAIKETLSDEQRQKVVQVLQQIAEEEKK